MIRTEDALTDFERVAEERLGGSVVALGLQLQRHFDFAFRRRDLRMRGGGVLPLGVLPYEPRDPRDAERHEGGEEDFPTTEDGLAFQQDGA